MRIIPIIAASLLLLAITHSAHAQKKEFRLDATKGHPGSHTITYVIITRDTSPQKIVTVILNNTQSYELAYQYRVDENTVSLELLENPKLPELHADDTLHAVTAVSVTDVQYAESKRTIETHIREADTTDSPEIRFYNCISEVLKTCGMRLPYRSPYRPPNPVQWIGDVPDYNKDLIPQDD